MVAGFASAQWDNRLAHHFYDDVCARSNRHVLALTTNLSTCTGISLRLHGYAPVSGRNAGQFTVRDRKSTQGKNV